MTKITDEELVLLYYGEHDDPTLASRVAESEELSARFDALCAEQEAGRQEQEAEREYFEVTEPISYRDEKTGTELLALPA